MSDYPPPPDFLGFLPDWLQMIVGVALIGAGMAAFWIAVVNRRLSINETMMLGGSSPLLVFGGMMFITAALNAMP